MTQPTSTHIDLAEHRKLESEKYLAIKPHESAPLLIHNYLSKAQYDRKWTAATLMSRGLVTDLQGKIVARPFGKFFNLNEYIGLYGPVPSDEPFEVFDKLDGSLGILYQIDGVPAICTRGSFHSDQAKKANEILKTKFAHVKFDPSITYLFEIIYPENKIVVNYGSKKDLVLLAMIDTETGTDLPLADIGMPIVERFDYPTIESLLQSEEIENREGYVVKFASGLRVKVKFDGYKRLHKNCFRKITWQNHLELLSNGQELDLATVPDESFDEIKKQGEDLQRRYSAIEEIGRAQYREFPTRKEAALYFQKECDYPNFMFAILTKKHERDVIWTYVKAEKLEESNADQHEE